MNLRLSDAHHAELVARAESACRSLQRQIIFELFHGAVKERQDEVIRRGAALACVGATPSFGILSEGAEPAPQSGSPEKRGEGRRIPESAPTVCACREICGDDGDVDGPGVCKGLPIERTPLVEIVLLPRRPAS